MKVRDIMRIHLVRVPPQTPLSMVIRMYKDIPDSSRMTYVVDNQGRLQGVVTIFDLLQLILPEDVMDTRAYQLLENRENALEFLQNSLNFHKDRPAGEIMTANYVAIGQDELFLKANRLFVDKRVSAMPVLDQNGVLVGEITRRIILNRIAGHLS